MSVALHHEVAGPPDAPLLLLGGALGTSLDVWDPVVEALAEHLRVVRYDHRGHGGSPVPAGPYEMADLGGDVVALLDSLGVRRAHVAGVSIGGMVAMWLAAHAADRVDRLVLICTSAHMAPASRWAQRAADVLEAGSVAAVADPVVERWLTPPFAAEQPQVRAWLRAMLAGQPPDGYAACCGAIERMDLRDDLPLIAAPTLVVSGADDSATPPEHQEQIAAAIPGARLVSVPGAAHQAAVEQPAAAARLILDHLQASS